MDFSLDKAMNFLYIIFVLLVSLSVHESAHAYIAEKRGDFTGRILGRITLNPLKHLDPVGSIIVPILLFLFNLPVFGWAKPVPVNPRNFKNIRMDNALVSAAGPLSNLMLSAIAVLAMAFYMVIVGPSSFYSQFEDPYSLPQLLLIFSSINLLLMVFNILPIYPLDGSHIFEAVLPSGAALSAYEKIKPYGFLILLFLIMTPILGIVLTALLNFSVKFFVFFPLSLLSQLLGK
ncbi:MAG: site-2 protease family protein [Acidobacteriota bacterium]|jgi:Zn-dependent protease